MSLANLQLEYSGILMESAMYELLLIKQWIPKITLSDVAFATRKRKLNCFGFRRCCPQIGI
ncbi:Hypothetical protein FKW44_011799 [Caligus rogercresseyi]|uniref:Uncharacterized protein n=1 Tax=Caligus rogercresseyi TaxID=217165 RepID=A0A7T8KAH8_CALRO|nr:Hypothetical protein FKW44_011799 [Caligus rogercresseyi]